MRRQLASGGASVTADSSRSPRFLRSRYQRRKASVARSVATLRSSLAGGTSTGWLDYTTARSSLTMTLLKWLNSGDSGL